MCRAGEKHILLHHNLNPSISRKLNSKLPLALGSQCNGFNINYDLLPTLSGIVKEPGGGGGGGGGGRNLMETHLRIETG